MTNSTAPENLVPYAEDVVGLFLLPWSFAEKIHDWNVEWCHLWARLFSTNLFPQHGHEAQFQLEIPDPIATTDEQDLFA